MEDLFNIIGDGKAHVRVEMNAEDLMAFSHTLIQRAKDELGSMVTEAQKERMIKEAEGQAEATLKIQQANADGLRMLKEAAPDNAVLQIKSLEAFAKAADGQATKIIIPSDIQGIAGLSKSIVEIAKENG